MRLWALSNPTDPYSRINLVSHVYKFQHKHFSSTAFQAVPPVVIPCSRRGTQHRDFPAVFPGAPVIGDMCVIRQLAGTYVLRRFAMAPLLRRDENGRASIGAPTLDPLSRHSGRSARLNTTCCTNHRVVASCSFHRGNMVQLWFCLLQQANCVTCAHPNMRVCLPYTSVRKPIRHSFCSFTTPAHQRASSVASYQQDHYMVPTN